MSIARKSDYIGIIKGDFLQLKQISSNHKIRLHLATIIQIQCKNISCVHNWFNRDKYLVEYFEGYTKVGCCIVPNYVIRDIIEEFNNKSIF